MENDKKLSTLSDQLVMLKRNPLFAMEFSFAVNNSEKIEITVFKGDDPEKLANDIAAKRGSPEIADALKTLIQARLDQHTKIRPQSPSMLESSRNTDDNNELMRLIRPITEDDAELPTDFILLEDRVSELTNSSQARIEVMDLTKMVPNSTVSSPTSSSRDSDAERFSRNQLFWSGQKPDSKNVINLLSKLKVTNAASKQPTQSQKYVARPSKHRLFSQAKTLEKRKTDRIDAQKKEEMDQLKASQFKVKSISSESVGTKISVTAAKEEVFNRFQVDIAQRIINTEKRIETSKQLKLDAENSPNWSCPKCTFENLFVALVCKSCTFSKPVSSYAPTNVAQLMGCGIVDYDAMTQNRNGRGDANIFDILYRDTSIDDSRLKAAELVDQELTRIAPFCPIIPRESIRIVKERARKSLSSPIRKPVEPSDSNTQDKEQTTEQQVEQPQIHDRLYNESTILKQKLEELNQEIYNNNNFTPSINQASRTMLKGRGAYGVPIEDRLIVAGDKRRAASSHEVDDWYKIDHLTGQPMFTPSIYSYEGRGKKDDDDVHVTAANETNAQDTNDDDDDIAVHLKSLKHSSNIMANIKKRFSRKIFAQLLELENRDSDAVDEHADNDDEAGKNIQEIHMSDTLLSSIPSNFTEKYIQNKLTNLITRQIATHTMTMTETEFVDQFILEMDRQPFFGDRRPYIVSSLSPSSASAKSRASEVEEEDNHLHLVSSLHSTALLRKVETDLPRYQSLIDRGKVYESKKKQLEMSERRREMMECTFMPNMATNS